ncbi:MULTISPECIES: thiol peroxidase [Brevibacterium]|uniref:Thiol peroxidase n=1 Tax=Brevibacterium casei TaxID=33889 RepID=A0A7T3ZX72_9MICO|nr:MULTISPECIES: thiol peroxidase [Brevibacterium]MCM1014211.1 thiol peroxidase [Brevibacterium sp. XM4083]QQB13291.1 thiol peroxidase [Brevibacterium casei]
MATTALEGNPVHTSGDLPAIGTQAPAYTLVGNDLGEVNSSEFADSRVVLNIFPSVDTGVCAASVRRFNELAASLENTTVVCVSNDLPFAQARFCGAESIDDVVTASAFRSAFGKEYGVTMVDGPLAGLLARAVVVLDDTGTVIYTQLVDEITTEPDYDAAMASLGA